MEIHHIGYLTKNLRGGVEEFCKLGFKPETEMVLDEERKIQIIFMVNGKYRIELIQPKDSSSPFYELLKKYKNTPYHFCYLTKNINQKIEELRKNGYLLLKEPLEAPAIKNYLAAFMLHPNIGIIELLETEDG